MYWLTCQYKIKSNLNNFHDKSFHTFQLHLVDISTIDETHLHWIYTYDSHWTVKYTNTVIVWKLGLWMNDFHYMHSSFHFSHSWLDAEFLQQWLTDDDNEKNMFHKDSIYLFIYGSH